MKYKCWRDRWESNKKLWKIKLVDLQSYGVYLVVICSIGVLQCSVSWIQLHFELSSARSGRSKTHLDFLLFRSFNCFEYFINKFNWHNLVRFSPEYNRCLLKKRSWRQLNISYVLQLSISLGIELCNKWEVRQIKSEIFAFNSWCT